MNLHQLFLTGNECYEAGVHFEPKGLCWHSTGAINTQLRRYVNPDDGELGQNQYNNHWNQHMAPELKCVHGFIGTLKNGEIATYQTLPWDMRGWHVGKGKNGTYNDTHIGIEICQGSNTDSVYFTKAYVEAVEVSVYLCKRFGWNDTNITTHCEAYKEGYGSNHGDVNSYFVHFGKSISTLRSDVKKILEGDLSEMYKIVIGSYETKEAAQTAIDKFKELASIAKIEYDNATITAKYEVTASNLFYHNKYPAVAGDTSSRLGKWPRGTIVDVVGGWSGYGNGYTWVKVVYNGKIVYAAKEYLKAI